MLSRVADCLYWMSRHVDRADNTARLVEMNLQLMVDVPTQLSEELKLSWLPTAACLGDEKLFRKHYEKPDAASVTEFLVFDRDNPNSIVSCLAAARENARTVREQISGEMWEQINRSYLWGISKAARQKFERNPYEFFQTIKEISDLFQAVTNNSMIHGEGWDFIQMGKWLERADKTSRILDDKFHILRRTGKRDELLQWSGVLRCCSARLAYQKIYVADVQPIKVAEFLILNRSFPRAILFCVQNLDSALRRVSGVAPGHYSNQAEKISGRLLSELNFCAIDEIYEQGLHLAMDLLQVRFNQIGASIATSCIYQALPAEPVAMALQPVQAQQMMHKS